jgi:uncharacterized protein (DUF2252 family)
VPRSSQARWLPAPNRPDPLIILETSNQSRLADLVPIRYGRMLLSPFAYLRGAASVMAHDLAATQVTGLMVQLCGDAHLGNFGTYATPERHQVFDLNDFDETLPGPWEWDIKRLVASVVVAGRTRGFSEAQNVEAVQWCVQSYRHHLWEFSGMRYLERWYARVDAQSTLLQGDLDERRYLTRAAEKARQRTSIHSFPKLTEHVQGQYRIKDEPPLIRHLADEAVEKQVRNLVEGYGASLPEEREVLLSHYHLVDLAQKVAGVGSVGTRCYVALLLGDDHTDPLFLQIKEAQPSVLEAHLAPSRASSPAQRVVMGQHLIQGASDIFLGWAQSGARSFYVRQLRDMSLSAHLEHLRARAFLTYVELCGWVLARAHARSGDAVQLSSYLGRNEAFDQAMATFATTYADQVEQDYAALVRAAQMGRIHAVEEA